MSHESSDQHNLGSLSYERLKPLSKCNLGSMNGLDSPCAHGAHMARCVPSMMYISRLRGARAYGPRHAKVPSHGLWSCPAWVWSGVRDLFCFCFSGPPRDRLFDLVSTAELTSAARRCHVDDRGHPSRSVAARGEAASGGVRCRRRAVAALGRCAAVVAGRCG